MISVAGVRGVVGRSLTPPVLSRFAAAFARTLGPGAVVVGRDARRSGPMVYHAVAAGLRAAGRDVIDLGLATTPTTQVAVEELQAAGGIILTASHNPAEWNALKFLSSRGEFLDAEAGAAVRKGFESGDGRWEPFDHLGSEREEPRALEWHIDRVLGISELDLGAIRERALTVAVDGCASVGGIAVPALLERLGARVVRLDCEPTGAFQRVLVPLPEHLGALGRMVRSERADFGVALDPDADRAALVDAAGDPLGEEYTLALAAQVVLARRPGPVVTNLSTSRIMDAVCARMGATLHRTPVGEAHVVAAMRAQSAVVGGEGNGGVILPGVHYGRDGLVAVALTCQLLSASGRGLRESADELPRMFMVKDKMGLRDEPWDVTAARLARAFSNYDVDRSDGLRFSGPDGWLHVRPSGTEPVVRLIAETEAAERTRELVARARAVVEGGGS